MKIVNIYRKNLIKLEQCLSLYLKVSVYYFFILKLKLDGAVKQFLLFLCFLIDEFIKLFKWKLIINQASLCFQLWKRTSLYIIGYLQQIKANYERKQSSTKLLPIFSYFIIFLFCWFCIKQELYILLACIHNAYATEIHPTYLQVDTYT